MTSSGKAKKVVFTEFRNDSAFYLDKLAKGKELQIVNVRRNMLIVGLTHSKRKWIKTV